MARPTQPLGFATDANYTHGPVIGQPNKTQPPGEAEGLIPNAPGYADYLNYELNKEQLWIAYNDRRTSGLLYGPGSDGAIDLNGTNTPPGFVLLFGNYAQARPVFATTFVIRAGVTLELDGNPPPFCTDTFTAEAGSFIAANGGAGGDNGGAIGPGAQLGYLGGGGDGGLHGISGAAGVSTTYSIGGDGGGSSTGAPHATATTIDLSPPAGDLRGMRISTIGHFIAGGAVRTVQGGAGGSGGGGGGAGSGGGGGGPIIGFARNWVLAANVFQAKGGKGGDSAAAGGAGGGGGGGVALFGEAINGAIAGFCVVTGGAPGTGGPAGTTAGANGTTQFIQLAA